MLSRFLLPTLLDSVSGISLVTKPSLEPLISEFSYDFHAVTPKCTTRLTDVATQVVPKGGMWLLKCQPLSRVWRCGWLAGVLALGPVGWTVQ